MLRVDPLGSENFVVIHFMGYSQLAVQCQSNYAMNYHCGVLISMAVWFV